MRAARVFIVFVVMGLLIGGGFGFARWRETQNAGRAAASASPLANPGAETTEEAEARAGGLTEGRLVTNHMGVRTVCGRANGANALWAGGHLYSSADRNTDDFQNLWPAWCAPGATEPVSDAPAAKTS